MWVPSPPPALLSILNTNTYGTFFAPNSSRLSLTSDTQLTQNASTCGTVPAQAVKGETRCGCGAWGVCFSDGTATGRANPS